MNVQDRSPGGGFKAIEWAVLVFIALLFITALAIGGWKLGWWLKGANANQQYQVNVNTQQYQASLLDRERNYITGWQTATDQGQKAQIKASFCTVLADLTITPLDISAAANTMGGCR